RDVLGADIERIRHRMIEAQSWQERFGLLDNYLSRLEAQSQLPHRPRREVVEAWRWIESRRGMGSIAELARHVQLSERQLRTLFTAELGLSPKSASRLMRFEYARQRISTSAQAREPLQLSDTAHACGYVDHSH